MNRACVNGRENGSLMVDYFRQNGFHSNANH